MKLSDLNKFFFYLIIFLNLSISNAQEEVDIWKKDNSNNNEESVQKDKKKLSLQL